MPIHQPSGPATEPAVDTSSQPSADLVALSSNELMVARRLAYDPENDALGEGDLWVEYMESEDDCMAARQIVPFDTFTLSVWHTLAADMFEERSDERDASQIDQLIERRGLFPHDPANGPRRIALPAIELQIALEKDIKAGSCRIANARIRVDALDQLSGMEPDFYTNPEAISTAGWDALSVTIFEQTCTAPTGGRFGNIFDQPDLTTGTPLAHARAQLFELQTALATAKRSRRQDPVFKIYVRSMMDELLAMPPLLEAIHNDHSGAFRIVAAFLDDHHPEWSEGLSKNQAFSPLLPLPVDWNGHVDIVGLVQDSRARMSAETVGVAPQFFGLYAGRRDGSSVWLGAAACEADAHALVTRLG